MILVLGGTTEGRIAVQTLDEAGKLYYYSTKGPAQKILCRCGIHIAGALNETKMNEFCKNNNIQLIVDAAHPFAVNLHQTAVVVARCLNIPIIRFERLFAPRDPSVMWCENYEDAISKLIYDGRKRLLALTGVQTIKILKPYWNQKNIDCYFRILDRIESINMAKEDGFMEDNLLFYKKDSDECMLFAAIKPDSILIKESGSSSNYEKKIEVAKKLSIPIYVIKRPALPEYTCSVTGKYGLRRAIEKLLPSFYSLHSGYTTGSCATAAAKAALLALLYGKKEKEVNITLPDNEEINIPVVWNKTSISQNQATAYVIKDAGSDPDVTNGCEIGVKVAFSDCVGIHFLQGEGVGVVTLPGIGISVGEPAINPVPRSMIINELSALYTGGLDITISILNGRELAKRTFNPKLGILNGLSILGTSGIVMPFSIDAFVESIRREIEVCIAVGASRLVINSGAKSERYIKEIYPELPPQAFVHYGNFIGETIKIASELGIRQLTMGIMIGKAVKLAEGKLNTHSKQTTMNKDFLKGVARSCNCTEQTIDAIDNAFLARDLWNSIPKEDHQYFFSYLVQLCYAHTAPLLPNGQLIIYLINEDGNIKYKAPIN